MPIQEAGSPSLYTVLLSSRAPMLQAERGILKPCSTAHTGCTFHCYLMYLICGGIEGVDNKVTGSNEWRKCSR